MARQSRLGSDLTPSYHAVGKGWDHSVVPLGARERERVIRGDLRSERKLAKRVRCDVFVASPDTGARRQGVMG